MTQSVKYLYAKIKTWYQEFAKICAQWHIVAYFQSHCWKNRGRRVPRTFWPASLAEIMSYKFNERPCLKNSCGKETRVDINADFYLTSIHRHTWYMQLHTYHMYTHTKLSSHIQHIYIYKLINIIIQTKSGYCFICDPFHWGFYCAMEEHSSRCICQMLRHMA